jgi:hypothetical protein
LLRNSFRYASKKDWAGIAKGLKPVCTARSEQATLDRFAEFSETWVANARPSPPAFPRSPIRRRSPLSTYADTNTCAVSTASSTNTGMPRDLHG